MAIFTLFLFTLLYFATDGLNASSTVRLVNGTSPSNGRVEIYHDGEWGTVCDSFFDEEETGVICVMLGYSRRKAIAYSSAYYGSGKGKIWYVRCFGRQTDIEDCSLYRSQYCEHSSDVGVSCSDGLNTGSIVRLVNGTSPSNGIVEIYHDGKWGTVCDDFLWDEEEAGVICVMLGYSRRESITYSSGDYGYRKGKFWRVNCKERETDIGDCHFYRIDRCSDRDARVLCSNGAYVSQLIPYSRACSECDQFLEQRGLLTDKLMLQTTTRFESQVQGLFARDSCPLGRNRLSSQFPGLIDSSTESGVNTETQIQYFLAIGLAVVVLLVLSFTISLFKMRAILMKKRRTELLKLPAIPKFEDPRYELRKVHSQCSYTDPDYVGIEEEGNHYEYLPLPRDGNDIQSLKGHGNRGSYTDPSNASGAYLDLKHASNSLTVYCNLHPYLDLVDDTISLQETQSNTKDLLQNERVYHPESSSDDVIDTYL